MQRGQIAYTISRMHKELTETSVLHNLIVMSSDLSLASNSLVIMQCEWLQKKVYL